MASRGSWHWNETPGGMSVPDFASTGRPPSTTTPVTWALPRGPHPAGTRARSATAAAVRVRTVGEDIAVPPGKDRVSGNAAGHRSLTLSTLPSSRSHRLANVLPRPDGTL